MNQLARNWWLLALRGVLAILLGVVMVLIPGVTLTALVLLVGAFAFVAGVTNLVAGIRERRKDQRWWGLILQGLVGIAVGIIALAIPLATALTLVALLAAWAIASGALEILVAIRLRREIEGEWLLFLGGGLSVLFGIAIILLPSAGLLALVWIFAAYLFSSGVVLLMAAFRLRRRKAAFGALHPDPAGA